MPHRPYADFDLRITSGPDGSYLGEVINSPVGTAPPASMHWPFPSSQHMVRLELENALLKSRMRGFRGPLVTSEEKKLRDFGSEMFKAVFRTPEPIAQILQASRELVESRRHLFEGLRVRLLVEPHELSILPWEYVFDESLHDPASRFMSLSPRSPLVRFLHMKDTQYQHVDGALKVLGMIANPGGADWELLNVAAERDGIEQAIKSMENADKVKLRWVHGETVDHLLDAIQRDDWHVFHFIGHGATEEVTYDDGITRIVGYLVFSDGQGGWTKVYPDELARYLQSGGDIRLAVLNCCDSGRGSSPGAALVTSGIPAVVAMQFPVSNKAACCFSSRFYNALVTGQTVEKALTVGRLSMQKACNLEWGIPVLFTRPGSNVFFGVQESSATGEEFPKPGAAATAPKPDVDSRLQSAREELRRLMGGAH